MIIKKLTYLLAISLFMQPLITNASDASIVCRPYVNFYADEAIDFEIINKEFGFDSHINSKNKLIPILSKTVNDVFPNVYKFIRSFETDQVAYLYERVIYQSDLKALEIIVKLIKSTDKQLQNDSAVAVAFFHFQLNTESDIKRGMELINQAASKENYPGILFKARTYLFDGPYTAKDLNAGLSYLNRTGTISQDLNQKKIFDSVK